MDALLNLKSICKVCVSHVHWQCFVKLFYCIAVFQFAVLQITLTNQLLPPTKINVLLTLTHCFQFLTWAMLL